MNRQFGTALADLISGSTYRISIDMKNLNWIFGTICRAFLLALAIGGGAALAQDSVATGETAKLASLEYIQTVLTSKLQQRSELGDRIETANEQDKEDLRIKAQSLNILDISTL